jgi:hypothetical protein
LLSGKEIREVRLEIGDWRLEIPRINEEATTDFTD